MKLKSVICSVLAVGLLLSNTTLVEAKTKKLLPLGNNYSKVVLNPKELVKGQYTNDNRKDRLKNHSIHLTNDLDLADPMNIYEYLADGGTKGFYTRRSKVSTKKSKPDEYGYIDTTVTFNILENLVTTDFSQRNNSFLKEIGTVYDIIDSTTLNSYLYSQADIDPTQEDIYDNTRYDTTSANYIPPTDATGVEEARGATGVVLTQVLDRYTGINLQSGLEDYTDPDTGVEYKDACVFKAKGKKWVVQVTEAKKTKPTKKNPFGTIVFKVHHHKDYKGLAFGQFLGYKDGDFSGHILRVIKGLPLSYDYSVFELPKLNELSYDKRLTLKKFMKDEWLFGDYTLIK